MAIIINGKAVAQKTKDKVKRAIAKNGLTPGLAVILIGENPASKTYVKNKKIACQYVGINSFSYDLPEKTSEKELINLINKLNNDKKIDGILIQLPLPKHINKHTIISTIKPEKDVDGFHPLNVGNFYSGLPSIIPCTPAGIIELLLNYKLEISGKHAVVVGRSNIVGKPIAQMLLERDATVSICHKKTKRLSKITSQADILISATGVAKLIKKGMVKKGAVVIDVGINRNKSGKLCGDVDFENVKTKTKAITPVPGGVGPMTIAMLLKNCLEAYQINNATKKTP